ncbi:hypothetical protein I6J18_04260 [Peribacillus psychrosaccharolyticus]|uniref:Uncharacterized protein n=1 Tax=Peribacillus psychrosaccharolyticus TaxID=1407 RepID=A0A974S161_PERPY|nr:hypothetical protein [Peribacillus psychrosaccharolyticus]MEC2057371.1 hypothetical protein [Peribacillus psychrosaccharolyticus]MED3742803.1 hypothetical protein [Peribacillus psychrosaccharolyticus]QQT01123.1 hypothetical protein I6J18_04260 [Peribacillus psychrosaccharolyticus]
MKIAWYLNLIGLIFSIIGFTKLGHSNSQNLFLISGLTIQTIAVVMYYISKFKDNRAK